MPVFEPEDVPEIVFPKFSEGGITAKLAAFGSERGRVWAKMHRDQENPYRNQGYGVAV